jgi:spore maturation protein SpmB
VNNFPLLDNWEIILEQFTSVILSSGRSAVELSLLILLPIMILMLSLMRGFEAMGWLGRIVNLSTPILRPFGLNGLGVFAVAQVSFVSFAAPLATLAIMVRNGCSDRHIAATLAAVLVLAQGNVTFPMAAAGLNSGVTLLIAMLGGLTASAATWYLFGRGLSAEQSDNSASAPLAETDLSKNPLIIIRNAGKDAWDISMAALPMLVISLVVVNLLRLSGLVDELQTLASPLFEAIGYPAETLLLVFTKYIAGGTAMMGIAMEQLQNQALTVRDINLLAGTLCNSLDVAGVAIMMSAGKRMTKVVWPAILGACVGVLLRTFIHSYLYL